MLNCRLCLTKTNDFKHLCDENGEDSEIYHITVKYFDPMMLLSSTSAQDCKVICDNCWHHISEFYEFQRSVLVIQTKLEDELKPLVKLENEILLSQETHPNNEYSLPFNDIMENELLAVDVDNSNHVKVLGTISTDDEKPLLLRTNLRPKRKFKIDKTTTKQKSAKAMAKICKSSRSVKKIKTTEKTRINKKGNSNGLINAEKESTKPENQTDFIDKEILDLHEVMHNVDNASSNYDSDDNRLVSNEEQEKRLKKSQRYDAFIAEWKRNLDCPECSDTFLDLSLLRVHFKEKHPKQKCYVLCCQRKLYFRRQMVEHIRLHIDPSIFKCELCGKCFTQSRSVKKHMREKHTEEGQERRFECNICHKRFAKKAILKGHMDIHATGSKDHVCKECGKGFVLASRLRIHERTVHNVDCVCDQCGKTIHGKYALKQHLLEHAGIMRRKYPCDQCEAQLNSHSSLKRHKQAVHHDGTTVYVCNECGKIAPSEPALLSHKKYVHQAERKYKCSICDKAFKVALVLKEHMAAHTGQDLYQCPHCSKTFKVSSNMHHHRKKAHPVEWAEARRNKPQTSKIDVNLVSNEVIL